MNNILSSSKDINHEYCCTVVRIGEVRPVEGSDFLGQTFVNGLSIVVRKDFVKEGDILFYASNESQLNLDFLAVTNQFDLSHRSLNKNFKEVDQRLNLVNQLRNEDKFDEANEIELEAKQMVGFFNANGRVKMIKLRGCYSMGYLFSVDAMELYCPAIKDIDLSELVNTDFDTVDGQLFIKAYVPERKELKKRSNSVKSQSRVEKYDRMIPGQFMFHYDTQQLNRSIDRISPDMPVTVSVKIHGTSFISGNVKVKIPKFGGLYSKIFNYLPKFLQFTYEDYDNVYSSRTVIKNKYINNKVSDGYYETDIWGEYNEIIKQYIPKGMTLYGEIFGYLTGQQKMIQSKYDYGCPEGTNKLMPYRITTMQNDGTLFEWNVQEVHDWTVRLMSEHPEIADRLYPIDIVYNGTLGDLYPNLDIHNHWHENVLEEMKSDKRHFGMEQNEPLCKNKVPREGIVLRIVNDPLKEAFKLKCLKFLKQESEEIDNGTYEDIEVDEHYK